MRWLASESGAWPLILTRQNTHRPVSGRRALSRQRDAGSDDTRRPECWVCALRCQSRAIGMSGSPPSPRHPTRPDRPPAAARDRRSARPASLGWCRRAACSPPFEASLSSATPPPSSSAPRPRRCCRSATAPRSAIGRRRRCWGCGRRRPARSRSSSTSADGATNPGVRVHRSRILDRHDVWIRHGLPVTSPSRTLLDLAPTATDRQLELAFDRGITERTLSPSHVADAARPAPAVTAAAPASPRCWTRSATRPR